MTTNVVELKEDLVDQKVKLSDLLRKSFEIVKGSGNSEFQNWIESELYGYNEVNEIPDYRQLTGELRGLNPYKGWLSIDFEDSDVEKRLSIQKIKNPISELEALIEKQSDKSQCIIPIKGDLRKQIVKAIGYDIEINLFIPKSKIIGLVDKIRTKFYEKILELEKNGKLDLQKQNVNGRRPIYGIFLFILLISGGLFWLIQSKFAWEPFLTILGGILGLIGQFKRNKFLKTTLTLVAFVLFLICLYFTLKYQFRIFGGGK